MRYEEMKQLMVIWRCYMSIILHSDVHFKKITQQSCCESCSIVVILGIRLNLKSFDYKITTAEAKQREGAPIQHRSVKSPPETFSFNLRIQTYRRPSAFTVHFCPSSMTTVPNRFLRSQLYQVNQVLLSRIHERCPD